MSKLFIFSKAIVTALVIMAFVSCNLFEQEEDSIINELGSHIATATEDTPLYFNLGSGEEVTSSEEWDIMLESTLTIRTSSGVSVSGGLGGVYYTGSSDFDSVTSVNETKFSEPNSTDSTYYRVMMGPATEIVMNVMNYKTYNSGVGTEADPFQLMSGSIPANTFYLLDSSRNPYASNYVYVIKGADGSSNYRLQVTAAEYNSDSTGATINFQFSKL